MVRMRLSDPFSLENLRKERTIQEFVAWVESVLEETRDREDLKEIILLRKGHAKEFYEEIFPTWRWIKTSWMMTKEATLRFLIDHRSPDAILTWRGDGGQTQQPIECVCAIDGYDDRLRMEHLLEHGRVSLTAPLRVTNTKASGRRRIVLADDLMMRPVDVSRKKQMELFESCLRRKLSKTYPTGTWLLCSFDDYLLRARKDHLAELPDLVAGLSAEYLHPFSRIIVVGMSGDIHFEWEEAKQ